MDGVGFCASGTRIPPLPRSLFSISKTKAAPRSLFSCSFGSKGFGCNDRKKICGLFDRGSVAGFCFSGDEEGFLDEEKEWESKLVRTLLIDNYDSYTYNIFQDLSVINGGEFSS